MHDKIPVPHTDIQTMDPEWKHAYMGLKKRQHESHIPINTLLKQKQNTDVTFLKKEVQTPRL
jgi:hypothetical protein